MNAVESRLDQIRGLVAPKSHNARTIAALTSNPGCARRAIMDAAGADKQRLAAFAGFPAPFGQSQAHCQRRGLHEPWAVRGSVSAGNGRRRQSAGERGDAGATCIDWAGHSGAAAVEPTLWPEVG